MSDVQGPRMVLAGAGGVNHGELCSMAEKYFAKIGTQVCTLPGIILLSYIELFPGSARGPDRPALPLHRVGRAGAGRLHAARSRRHRCGGDILY